jgi:hypothetical protein
LARDLLLIGLKSALPRNPKLLAIVNNDIGCLTENR